MFSFFKNIIVLDLKKTKVKDLKRLLIDNNIPDHKVTVKFLTEEKKNGGLKVFLDRTTYNVIAILYKGDSYPTFSMDFAVELSKLKNTAISSVSNLDLNSILEKINESGMDSLTKSEMDFLDSASK